MLRTCNSIKAGGFHTFLSLIFHHSPWSVPLPPACPVSSVSTPRAALSISDIFPFPHPGITTIAAQYLPPTMLDSVLGCPVLTVALQSTYSWFSDRLKEKKKKFKNFAEGYISSTWYRQDMNSDLPCPETCFCSLHCVVLPLPSARNNILDRRLKLSQPNKRAMRSSPA